MAAKSIASASETVSVSTDVHASCKACKKILNSEQIHEKINHYLKHGYRLLHVGSQTTESHDGHPWQTTVAVLGK